MSLSSLLSAFPPLLVVVVFFKVVVGFLKPVIVAFFLSAVVAAAALRGVVVAPRWPTEEAPAGALSLGCFLLTFVSLIFSLTWLLSVTLEFLDDSLLLPLDGVFVSVSVVVAVTVVGVVVVVVEMGSSYKTRRIEYGDDVTRFTGMLI